MVSESGCLLRQLNNILDSEAGLRVAMPGGVLEKKVYVEMLR